MPSVVAGYVELHAKSFYSFGEGASHTHELLAQAKEHAYASLALIDTNLCGALEFARLAGSLGIQPITGGELTLDDGSRLVLLAETRQGYANISRLFTLANAVDRREPRLDPAHLPARAEGVVLLAGGRDGRLSRLALEGRRQEARELLKDYMKWYGSEYVYVELQQALVAAKRNSTIDQALPFIRHNHHLHLKSQAQMDHIFKDYPEAIPNTLRIAEQCAFDLSTDLGYNLPEPAVPEGYTAESYLERLCFEAALRRYGSMSKPVKERLEEEFRLIGSHRLAGFLLLYREIVLLAQQIMKEKGMAHPEIPLEERPSGRGRGSSVALLAGYLIGISHVNPLRWDLTQERFISDDMSMLPDIDLDFPRGLRDELILRVHRRFGPDYAVLAGAVATYAVTGIIQDLGKALGPRRRKAQRGNAGASRLQGQGGCPGLAGADRAGPTADGCAQEPGPARRGHGSQQLAHLRDGPNPGGGDQRAVHHGLEQGQRGRRQLRQDRSPLIAGAGPARGSPRPHRG